ncbi:MAG TPA: alpha/beta hydrolase [Burkholderiales bacterium]|nr:alpha/beta hydrolase [Burkholderiales bacterium]
MISDRTSNHESRITIDDSSARQLTLRDGRRIGYAEFGAAGGRPVLYCHGFPASRLDGRLGHEAALRLDLRLIAPDRPGYGLSDYQPARRITDWPRDVLGLADGLALERFAVLGISGGAPYAIACAAALADRITAVGIVGGLARVDIAANSARMNPFARFSFALARRAPHLSQLFNRALAPALRDSPRWTLRLLSAKLPPPDRKVLADAGTFAIFADAFREGFRQGGRGAALDLTLLAQPWETAPESIRAPCHVWHGEQDTTVPVEMGRWLARSVPGCRASFFPEDGHFSLPVNRIDEILRALAAAQ